MIATVARPAVWVPATFLVILCLLFFSQSGHVQRVTKNFTSSRASDHVSRNLLEDIHNRTLGFQKVFVINMKTRPDRRDSTSLAASLTGVDLEYIDAVTEVNTKSLPPGGIEMDINQSHLGCWRSHLMAARTILEENLESALILEDDVDWDIRLKDQLTQFAKATQLLLQPVAGGDDNTFLDHTYHSEYMWDQTPQTFHIGNHQVKEPTTSPYGDTHLWDMLWIGHCGGTMPPRNNQSIIPIGRVAYHDDSVAKREWLNPQFGTTMPDEYPQHTRLVFRSDGNVCTQGYALTKQGARRMLWELGLKEMNGGVDLELDAWCRGTDGRRRATCVTALPPFMGQHRPRGFMSTMSELDNFEDKMNEQAYTENIRLGTKVNLDKLVHGETDYIDSYKDGKPAR